MSDVNVTPDLVTQLSEGVEEENSDRSVLKKHWHFILKVFQLIFGCLCIGLLMEPAKRGDLGVLHLDHLALVFPTFIAYVLVVIVFVIAKAIGDKIPYKTCFIFSVLAACLYFVSTILLAVDNKSKYFNRGRFYIASNHMLGLLAGSTTFALFSAALFATEAVLTWRFQEDF